ncbi:atherin-like [Lontra canadensis]|uniref:atherin-like n=1 Tax=Lontra canadensis TaxID=76717 RepID=UPI0013F316FA|nr:atherin-like [Lontra canadensis]
MWKTRHLTACGHHPRPRAECGLGGPTGVASHEVGAGTGSRSARGSKALVAGDCLAGRRRPREGGLGGLWKRWSPEMGVKCVAQSCRGRTRNTRGRGTRGGAETRAGPTPQPWRRFYSERRPEPGAFPAGPASRARVGAHFTALSWETVSGRGPWPRARAVNRVAPSAPPPPACRGARPAAPGAAEARPRRWAVAAGARPLPAAPARPRRPAGRPLLFLF